jgi:hypothetical protein
LYVGGFRKVFHITTGGALLGSFTLPVADNPDNRFIDGLEFEAAPRSLNTPLASGVFTTFPRSPALSGLGAGFWAWAAPAPPEFTFSPPTRLSPATRCASPT